MVGQDSFSGGHMWVAKQKMTFKISRIDVQVHVFMGVSNDRGYVGPARLGGGAVMPLIN